MDDDHSAWSYPDSCSIKSSVIVKYILFNMFGHVFEFVNDGTDPPCGSVRANLGYHNYWVLIPEYRFPLQKIVVH